MSIYAIDRSIYAFLCKKLSQIVGDYGLTLDSTNYNASQLNALNNRVKEDSTESNQKKKHKKRKYAKWYQT